MRVRDPGFVGPNNGDSNIDDGNDDVQPEPPDLLSIMRKEMEIVAEVAVAVLYLEKAGPEGSGRKNFKQWTQTYT